MSEALGQLMLADTAAVRQLVDRSAPFGAFFRQALADSGLRVTLAQAKAAGYQVTLGKGVVHYDLRFNSRLGNADASPTVEDLVMPMLRCPVDGLIHGIWAAKTFRELNNLLSTLKAIVRFNHTPRGDIQGRVVMTSHIVMLLKMLEGGTREMSNGESVFDAVTRNLGLRQQVRLLADSAGNTTPLDEELTDVVLARSLIKLWHR